MTIAALVLTLFLAPARAQAPRPPEAADAEAAAPLPRPIERVSLPGLPNLARADEGLYRGGRPDPRAGMASLARLGVRVVIDLEGGDLNPPARRRSVEEAAVLSRLEPGESPGRIDAEVRAGAALGIEVASVPLDSLDPVDDAEAAALERILTLIRSSLGQGRPVYVHCEHGKDRTGLVIALYRMRFDGWTQDEAWREMRAMGHTGWLDREFTGHMAPAEVLRLHPALASSPGP